MTTTFGTIHKLDLRKLWPNEAAHFTPWLAQNIAALGEALGLDLELHEREASVGDFSLDLLATDLGTGRPVIIENQLSNTDHDHLGKLLTYAAGFDAGVVVWVASQIRDEHKEALEWLNQRTDADTTFFAVIVEVHRIDDSRPAYTLLPVVFPSEWQKEGRRASARTVSTRGEAYQRFFQSLIDVLRDKHDFTAARVGQPQNWFAFAAGITGLRYVLSFAERDRIRVELYIDLGNSDKNKAFFDRLLADRADIETSLGEPLEWERMEDRRASRVAVYRQGSIELDSEELETIHAWGITHLIKFKHVFGPRLRPHFEALERGAPPALQSLAAPRT
jgi:hypothetical protein